MRRIILVFTVAAVALAAAAGPRVARSGHERPGCTTCTDTGVCQQCVPACKATWDEKTSSKPKYSMTCEYACARGRDSWHAPAPECRCSPPCGEIFVRKRLYKTEGAETVERLPKYEVQMVAAEPCDCSSCSGGDRLCWWNPLNLVRRCGGGW